MIIDVKVIPHKQQRYETVGDWYFNKDNNRLTIRVSAMRNRNYEFLVALHEQVEAMLCIERGICEKEITLFDMKFEANRKDGNTDEPGDDPLAPYRKEHFFATNIERLTAAELGIDWGEYEKAVNSL
jgi:hypothetical protein